MTLFASPIFLWILLGASLFGAVSASVGSFAYLRKRSLVGDALAHAALPGVTLAFAITGSRRTEVLLLGAAASCWVAYAFIEWVSSSSKLKQDSVLAVTLSFFFSLGIFHLTHLQSTSTASQAGLDKLIFGQAAALTQGDVYSLAILSVLIGISIWVFYHRFLISCFDRSFAASLGLRLPFYDGLLLFLSVASIVLGLQLVGVVLMAALLITPAATARFWTSDTKKFILLSAFLGSLAAIFGTAISALYPRMPTGPWIVLSATAFFFSSVVFGFERGLFWSLRAKQKYRILEKNENIVRSIFLIEEDSSEQGVSQEQILRHRNFTQRDLALRTKKIEEQGLLRSIGGGKYTLTEEGRALGEKLTRRHRLFEVYLTEKAQFPPDLVHEYAERAEHVFTEELESEVRDEISTTSRDPHGKDIPK